MVVCRSSLRLIAAFSIALAATAGFAQSTITLNATSGTGTIATNYTTTGGLTLNMGFFAEYLVLAGGGGGGGSANDSTAWGSGGGGAGGLRTGTTALSSMSYLVQVGGGGAGGQMSATAASQRASSGAGSFLGGISATAGGAGGRFKEDGISAGSGGGGGGRASASGGAGNVPATTPSQGNDGGDARADDIGGQSAGGGGGGAGAAGGNAGPTSSIAGNGGNGLASLITGSSVTYGGGGGGGAWNTGGSETAGTGGTGGGGAGSTSGNATAGTDGLGGGGGGAGTNGTGGQGGAGVVIVRYQGESLGNIGGSVTPGTGSAAGYTLHTFSTSGTTTSTSALNLSGVNMNARLGAVLTGTISGDGGLTYNGPGTLTLAANNTYTGVTTVSAGTLTIGNGGTTGSVTGDIVNNSAVSFRRSDATTYAGSISGTGQVVVSSVSGKQNLLTLTGNNSYTGGTQINGYLEVGSANALGSSGPIVFGNGGWLQFSASNTTDYSSRLSITPGYFAIINTNEQDVTFASDLQVPRVYLQKWGAGTLTLSGSNTFGDAGGRGTVYLVSGTLALGSANALGSGSTGSVIIFSNDNYYGRKGGVLQFSENNTVDYSSSFTVTAGQLFKIDTNGQNVPFASNISGDNQALLKLGGGALTLSGSNRFTVGTTLNEGTLALGSAGALGSTGRINFRGGTLQYSASNTTDYSSRFATSGTQSFNVDTNGQNVTFASNIQSLGGNLSKFGAGTLTLSGSNSFNGQTTVSAGTLILNSANALAPTAAVVVASGATLQANQPIRIGYLDSEGTVNGGENLTATLTVTRSGTIGGIANGTDSQGTFAAGMAKLGTGTSTVNATNTYTGLTWVREGTLAVGAANAFAAASDLKVDSGATFDRAGFSQTVANADLDGSVGNTGGGGLLTVTGTLSGSGLVNGDVTVTGVHAPGNSPGIQTFDGNLSYGNGAVVNWELIDNTQSNSPVVYDQIVLSSAANLSFSGSNVLALSFAGAGSLVDWTNSFWDVNRAWTVFDLASGVTTGFNNISLGGSLLDSNGLALDASRGSFSLSEVGEDVVLSYNVAAVPEPSTMVLALAGLACGHSMWRRRRAVSRSGVPIT
jgi:autotransporter-associated beta strand protein